MFQTLTQIRGFPRLFKYPVALPFSTKWGLRGIHHVPESSSYFTSNARFNEIYLYLENLLKYAPKVYTEEHPQIKWKSLQQYQQDFSDPKTSRIGYRRIVRLLDALNKISPTYRTESIQQVIDRFTHPSAEGLQSEKKLTVDENGIAMAKGKRKSSKATVKVIPGTGEVFVNGAPMATYFQRLVHRKHVIYPLVASQTLSKYNIWATVGGGGPTGQSGAIHAALTKALKVHEPSLQDVLRKAGCVENDKRKVERKKTGQPKARKKYTWVKR
ncbi:ribosomal protein subunit S9 [Schizosaccharomyces cryophilus OY26]|uniref:Small ribosomal subunit protein uS9m n=1 Tax=Schizosaccharomyces cryophilus (strain OY26 / ATCC MYA-4695 / CBS 11777 / NBRC 106824 / NRRL Y48691) TaxID=653667 RepID=S9VVR1_SCHCR|nr:ribosomal protein subunit S9 [Schizosaccharomyces cryophilus OY26]EPY50225.1 ribosomal protein subunit S9 [Schizosaccharomyces cryophilus OY26]